MQIPFRSLPVLAFLALAACEADKAGSPRPANPADTTPDSTLTTDSALYRLVKGNSFAFYKGKDTIWTPADNSPHGDFKLRFNAKALSALGPDGKLPVGGQFPDSSIVLKEFTLAGRSGYAAMLKLPRDTNSGSGWVWGEYWSDGTLVHSVTNKSQGCVHCHLQTPNRDFIRSFDMH